MFNWNQKIWESLRGKVEDLPHAVLIQGPEGVGKMALAERVAARLLCEAPTADSEPCGRCDGCRWVNAGSHPDLRRIEPDAVSGAGAPAEEPDSDTRASRRAKPSSEIRVDQIRELSDFLYLGSHRGTRRVALVHPAESMNVHAANALLKGLEEPPAGAMFLLVTHHPARLLPTIRSRCIVVAVPRPEEATALAWLESVIPDSQQARRWLAFAGGAPRLAQDYVDGARGARVAPLLEAIASGAGPDLPEATDRESLESLAEVLQKHAIDQLTTRLAGRSIYGTLGRQNANGRRNTTARDWAGLARRMGKARAMARHPVNARLFSAEMLSDLRNIIAIN